MPIKGIFDVNLESERNYGYKNNTRVFQSYG